MGNMTCVGIATDIASMCILMFVPPENSTDSDLHREGLVMLGMNNARLLSMLL